ncbi:hypothetical protein GmRootA79_08850 [Acidovorax sp. A79]|uniref:hypothetical protein n=1 Tax=Acidovorax sp. A79 TaxID=3056107 RepID=UPI0034E87D82
MNNVNETVQAFLRPHLPWTAAERKAVAQTEARQRAEDQRRQDRALMDQQQNFRSMGALR